MMYGVFAALLVVLTGPLAAQQRDIVLTGGWLFAATSDDRIPNPGILIRAGKLLRIGGDLSIAAPNAQAIRVGDDETIVPGMFDLHAHYAIDLYGVRS